MTVTEPEAALSAQRDQLSLGTAAARKLSTTTKSEPQMESISSRWLLRSLPWVEASGGVFRVNRRLSYTLGDGLITFTNAGSDVSVVPQELRELPPLRGFDDEEVLSAMADSFTQSQVEAGQVITEFGHRSDNVYLLAHGKANKLGTGKYGDTVVLDVLSDGAFWGERVLVDPEPISEFTVKAVTECTVLSLSRQEFERLIERSEALAAHIEQVVEAPTPRQNARGEAEIELASGHEGEFDLPGTFVDYETSPREYELSVAQTVLRVHSRVADLYNQPMDQIHQQLRLTIEALRERQEHELINNHDFGLLHNADLKQRIHTRTGPPTPDDLDELLGRRRKSRFFLAHPRTIAAFGRECNARGLYPDSVEVDGHRLTAWRGVPLLPCDKIPVSDTCTSSILVLRTGLEDQGVVGLHQTGLPDEYQPGLNVRFMGINEKAVISYLVSTYFSAAVMVPDALGVLENVEIGR